MTQSSGGLFICRAVWLEPDAEAQDSVPGAESCGSVVDTAEAGGQGSGSVVGHAGGLAGVGGIGVVEIRAVQSVEEHGLQIDSEPFVEGEGTAERDLFAGAAEATVVVVISSRGSPLPGCRFGPRGLIEDQLLVGIEAVAVDIDRIRALSAAVIDPIH